MRRAVMGASVSAVVCLAAALIPLAAVAGATARRSPAPVPVVRVDLHATYARLLSKERDEPKAIAYARGRHGPAVTPRAAAGAAACNEPACPVSYQGGQVQHSPKVYLLLWGPKWSLTGPDAEYLDHFLSGLGVELQDSWSTTTVQYGDATGHPTFSTSVLQGVFQDQATPPHGATQEQLAAEADAFYSAHNLTDPVNTQIVVATQSGTCPAGFVNCAGGGDYCAWHSSSTVNNVPFTNLPYLPDVGASCGEGIVNTPGTYDGFSIVEGHEYAESITDPFPDSGWIDIPDPSGGEVADKCAWSGLADVPLSTGSFAMQPLWSNNANRCVQSTLITITTSSLRTGSVGDPYNATVTEDGGTAPYRWSRISGTKPPGLSFSSAGVWTGTPTAIGYYSFRLQVTDQSGATATRALSIRIAPLSVTTNSFPAGSVGTAYHATAAATDGPGPYVWSRISGTKPPGLSFSSAGVWTGTPTAKGTYSFSLQVTDHLGARATKALSITVTPLPSRRTRSRPGPSTRPTTPPWRPPVAPARTPGRGSPAPSHRAWRSREVAIGVARRPSQAPIRSQSG